jgi:hypothetical protein
MRAEKWMLGLLTLGVGFLTGECAIAACTDAFASATALSGGSGSAAVSTIGAGGESGEPIHGGDSAALPLNSVWCRWTAPANGFVTFAIEAQDLAEPIIAVYTGPRVNSLTEVEHGPEVQKVTFWARAGGFYRIAIDGEADAVGSATLSWTRNVEVTIGAPAAGFWPDSCTDRKYFFPTRDCALPPFHDYLDANGNRRPDDADWSADLQIDAGALLRMFFFAPGEDRGARLRDSLTARVDRISDACLAPLEGGQAIRIGIFNGINLLGRVTYAHVEPIPGLAEGDEVDWGAPFALVGDYPPNPNCWTEAHVHFELLTNAAYACYLRRLTPGLAFGAGRDLGILGGRPTDAPRQAC